MTAKQIKEQEVEEAQARDIQEKMAFNASSTKRKKIK